MDDFVCCIHALHSHSGDQYKTEVAIRKISSFLKERRSDCVTDVLISLLFGENGILSFVKKLLKEGNNKSISSAFELLQFLVENFDKSCTPYVEEVKKLCLDIAHSHAHAKIRQDALKLLKYILVPTFFTALDLSTIMSSLNALNDKKCPSTVCAQLYSVIGIIFERIPEISDSQKDVFMKEFLNEIQELGNNVTLLEGCFQGIYGYLFNFAPHRDDIQTLYSAIRQHCILRETDVTRVRQRSALKIIIRHYKVFSKYIYEDSVFWRGCLNKWLAKTGEDRQLGIRGLISIYRAFASVFDASCGESDIRNLNSIAEELLLNLKTSFNIPSMIGLVELISTGLVDEYLSNSALQIITNRINDSSTKKSTYLPVNLECISKYMTISTSMKGDRLVWLESLAVRVISNYPNIDLNFRSQSLESLEKSFYHVYQCGRLEFDEYVKVVVYQGLMHSCCHRMLSNDSIQEKTGEEIISYKSYTPLWLYICNLMSSYTYIEQFQSKNEVASKVLDEYIISFLKINKLYSGFPEMDSYAEVEDSNQYDVNIFTNNVNLFLDVVDGIEDAFALKKWMTRIFAETVDSSYRSPLVSGHYKILTTCFKIADKLNFFNECSGMYTGSVQAFLRGVLMGVCRYKGDLQISCFQTLLAAPVVLIQPFIHDFVPIFKVMLRVGSGNFHLIKECLTTLEKWHKNIPGQPMEYLLRNILPYFNVFLQGKDRDDLPFGEMQPKPLRDDIGKINVFDGEDQLFALQKNFLLFLGKLDQNICRYLIQDVDTDEEEYYDNDLMYDIPLMDTKLRIRMQEILPRVIELSLSSSDRGTRVTACEFLNSVVLLTLGNMKQMNGELNGLFRKLMRICLLLACDSDRVIFQIYRPLMFQITHYFANREGGSSETQIFIDCLMESVSHPYNSTLRDFAAQLILELTVWSVKSSSPGTSNNMEEILSSMYSMSSHPDHNKRCGAAVIFNNIFSVIKEKTALLDTHWFLFYYHFIECLSMCSVHENTRHITNAIERIRASLTEKNLETPPESPPGFDSNSDPCFKLWIFTRCYHSHPEIRRLSMCTIEDIVRIRKYGEMKNFMNVHVIDVLKRPAPSRTGADEENHLSWWNDVTTYFDYYGWLVSHNVITENDLRTVSAESLMDRIFDGIDSEYPSVQIACAKSSALFQLLEFITSCIDRNIILCKRKKLNFIKICMFSPGLYGIGDAQHRERLSKTLTKLIPKLMSVLNGEEILTFSSIDRFRKSFQDLSTRLRSREAIHDMVHFLNGLRIARKLNLWAWFDNVIRGDDLLRLVFNSLFAEKHKRSYGIFIDPNDMVFLKDLVDFSLDIGVSLDNVLSLLKNGEDITEEDTFVKNTKGGYFLELFKSEFIVYFISNSESSVIGIVRNFPHNALMTIFESLKHLSYSGIPEKHTAFVQILYGKWNDLHTLAEGSNDKNLLLSIVRIMCKLKPSALVGEPSVCQWVFDVICGNYGINEVETALDLLPYLSEVNEERNDKLVSSLETFFTNNKIYSSEQCDPILMIIYNSLVNSFIRSRSLPILREIMKLLSHYKHLLKENDVEKIFSNIFMTGVPEEHLTKVYSYLYNNLFDGDGPCDKAPESRFIEILLRRCDESFAWKCLDDRLDDLVRIVKDEEVEKKILALKLIQCSVVRVKRDVLDGMTEEKKGMFRILISMCSKISGSGLNEMRRKYACSCFNTLCTIISSKTDDWKQYKCFIFKDDLPYLQHLVDRRKIWSLRMDFDELPKRRKVFTTLRRSITKERQLKLGRSLNSVKYLHMDTLFSSSLQEDVTKFDFSLSVVRPMELVMGDETDGSELVVELELDQLNRHECMATMVGLVGHLVEFKITSPDDTIPFWLSSIIQRMKSLSASTNEKIFLMKLMCNIGSHVENYGDVIVPIFLETLLEVFHEKPINYLTVDILTMIFSWKLDFSESCGKIKNTISRLIVYIIRESDSYRYDIIKSNLELAKLIVEACGDSCNTQILSENAFEGLKKTESTSAYLNLHFCAILLANSILPWLEGKEEQFMNLVLQHCHGKTGNLAAETAGIALKLLENNGFSNTDKLVEVVREKLDRCVKSTRANDLSLVYAVHKNYPKISSFFLNTLRTSAYSSNGTSKAAILEMLLSHVERLTSLKSDALSCMIHVFMSDMLTPDNPEALGFVLEIVKQVLTISYEKMEPIVEKAVSFSNSKHSRVRKNVYNIAMYVLESRCTNETIIRRCKIVLLDGLNDPDKDLSESCLGFWYTRTVASSSGEQFSRVLCEMYTPETENGFLNSAARLMIKFSSTSSGYDNFLFDHPLAPNCSFRKRKILTTVQQSTLFESPTGGPNQSSGLQYLSSAQSYFTMVYSSLSHNVSERREMEFKSLKGTKRFLKREDVSKATFSKRRITKKAFATDTRKHEIEVELYGEYSEGDFPNIQIKHSDLLKPLEVLTKKDPQISRHFVTSIYDGFVGKQPPSQAKYVYTKITELLAQVINDSTGNDPTLIAFLFHVMLHCDGRLEADSEAIARLARSSDWLTTGGLLIEEMIIRSEGEDELRRKKGITPEEKKWLHLAEICRYEKEFETLRGIFLDKLRVLEDAAEGIRWESVSDWRKASKCYRSALTFVEGPMNDFYVEAHLNCLARLSDWTALNGTIRQEYNVNNLRSDPSLFEKVFPWFLKSEMMLFLRSLSNPETLTELLTEFRTNRDTESKYFLEETAVAHFFTNNHRWVRYYLHQICTNFLSAWSHWNKWSNNSRASKLVQLQLLSEIDQCLDVFAEKDAAVDVLINTWKTNRPKGSDDLLDWDVKLTFRSKFLSLLQRKFPDLYLEDMRKSAVVSRFDLVKSAIDQGNPLLSDTYLNGLADSCRDHDLKLMHTYYKISLEIMFDEFSADRDARMKKLTDIANCLEREMVPVADTRNVLLHDCYMLLSKLMRLIQRGAEHVTEESLRYIYTQLGVSETQGNIKRKELDYLEKAKNMSDTGANLSKTYMEMFKYHRRHAGFNKELVKCLLKAMSLGSTEGRHLFCCLLHRRDTAEDWVQDPEIRKIAQEVPTWMFLKWTNQILANLGTELYPFAKDLLLRLAEEYPDAIRLPFQLSQDGYNLRHEYGLECRQFVNRLKEDLSELAHDKFVLALSYVAPPDMVCKYDFDRIATELMKPEPNWKLIDEIARDLYNRMYGDEYREFRGVAYDNFPLKHELEELLEVKHELSLWKEKMSSLTKSILKINTEHGVLKAYSPWLEKVKLEIPGQYDGEQKPMPKHHVTISSFEYDVAVMNSKCKPIRITILGNNAKKYTFLVKFGEDLRQDERIQQAFGHMNHVLRTNRETSRFHIDTYKVIPVKKNLGMIQWVSNTQSLYTLLTKCDPSIKDTIERVQQEHLEFLSQDANVTQPIKAHLNGYMKVNRDRAVTRFRERVHSFDWDLLRNAFWRLSSCPEQFVDLRKNFAFSNAVIYVAHWLIGIGDRHLDNILVSSATGRALGIDFGCAFGFATEFLKPPELVPFRLTPQIINLMKPLGESGIIKETMIQCLRAFRRENFVLLAILEVFVMEPSMNWLEKARRNHKSSVSDEVWSPRKKIAMVREKLNGVDPLKVFADDLKAGHGNSQYLVKYLEVLNDVQRSQFDTNLTEEQQVICLINLAINDHVLSKTYVGWNPWL